MRPVVHEWRDPRTQVRIAVSAWVELDRVEDQYIQRPRDLRMVWAYLGRVGPAAVISKIRSRLAETARNRKVAGVGVGHVLAAPPESGVTEGDRVAFFAPNVTEEPDCVVCDVRMVLAVSTLDPDDTEAGSDGVVLPEALARYVGWSPYSGIAPDEMAVAGAIGRAVAASPLLRSAASASRDDGPRRQEARERYEARREPRPGRPTAVLFGFGNYAKTQVLPFLRRRFDLRCIHEIDAGQLATAAHAGVALDTAPMPREHEAYDAWFIAGFHHLHAPLAVHALEQGAYAVTEKPVATTWDQFATLESALEKPAVRRLMACFQRRYSPMNDWAAADLALADGRPVHYHCIVYEIPLPSRHWYNWPNSRSRLTSNGCHWVDHFLHLNGYAAVVEHSVRRLANGDLSVVVSLENGAAFTMLLTEHGSERLGVRDHVELRARDVTVKMTDQAVYEAESSSRVMRRRSINPTVCYRRMYESIAQTIRKGGEGDPMQSLLSTRLTLMLEDELGTDDYHGPTVHADRACSQGGSS